MVFLQRITFYIQERVNSLSNNAKNMCTNYVYGKLLGNNLAKLFAYLLDKCVIWVFKFKYVM